MDRQFNLAHLIIDLPDDGMSCKIIIVEEISKKN